jgi:NAD(P)-dependent dehydrogenase (short-subunit alcohol dehydrogenase family)
LSRYLVRLISPSNDVTANTASVGGTSGIGESTARAFAQNANSPRIYLVGRSQEQASRIQAELHALNPSSQVKFVQSDDITLLKNVDKVCSEIQAAEKQVNLLFMTAGFLTLAGRTETTEGLDKKLNMNYYSRFRFIQNLLPQLTLAAEAGSLSRGVSVLAAGKESDIILDDLSLKTNYSGPNALKHAATMNSLMAMHLAELHPGTSFVHMSPGMVKTNMLRNMGIPSWIAAPALLLLTPFAVNVRESGERHLYASTSIAFPPKEKGGDGYYLLNQNDAPVGNTKVLKMLKEEGVAEKVWNHTLEVYKTVCDEGKKW